MNRANFSILWMICAILFVPPMTMHGQSAGQTVSQESRSEKNAWLRLANNGAWWNSLSADSKSDFIDGYVSAMTEVHKMLMALLDQGTKSLAAGAKFDSQMAQIVQLSVIGDRYDFQEVGRAKLLVGMDAFYKEPLNKLIRIDDAFAFERDTLNGKVAPRDLQKQLEEWRAVMNK